MLNHSKFFNSSCLFLTAFTSSIACSFFKFKISKFIIIYIIFIIIIFNNKILINNYFLLVNFIFVKFYNMLFRSMFYKFYRCRIVLVFHIGTPNIKLKIKSLIIFNTIIKFKLYYTFIYNKNILTVRVFL